MVVKRENHVIESPPPQNTEQNNLTKKNLFVNAGNPEKHRVTCIEKLKTTLLKKNPVVLYQRRLGK